MMPWRALVLFGVTAVLPSASAASEPGVKPVGVFPLLLPGDSVGPDARPKAMLWCQGGTLMGVVVPDERSNDCGTASPKRLAPTAFLVRDGRCESDGAKVSFGFLVSRKAWVFESGGRTPVERKVWLLHRFEGSLKAGQLKGVLVQVDVNHPGYAFQKLKVEADAVTTEQEAFNDESTWRSGMAQTFCLASGEP